MVSVLLCAVIMMTAALPAAAAYTYPEGVDAVKAYNSAYKIDEVLKNAVSYMGNKTLKDIVYETLITDETLSGLLVEIYKVVEENGETMGTLNIDYSPQSVAQCLVNFPQVSAVLSTCTSWSQVNLQDVSWSVGDKNGFAIAVASMFGPFNQLLYTLLCSGRYSMGLVTIQGDEGYQNAIVGILSALGCTDILSNEEFKRQATENMYSMMKNIVLSVFSFVDSVCASPLVRLSEVMPELAHYVKDGGLTSAIEVLVNPLTVKIMNLVPVLDGSELLSFIENPEESTGSITDNPTETVNQLLSSYGIQVAPIDLELISSCGTDENGYIKADISMSSAVIFEWIIDTLKLNKETIANLMTAEGGSFDISGILNSVLSLETPDLYAAVVELMTQTVAVNYGFEWSEPEFNRTDTTYTQNLGPENFQRVLDGIDDLINEFIKENGEEKTIQQMLKTEIYSPSLLTELTLGLYGELTKGDFSNMLSLLGIDASPSGLAKHIDLEFYKVKTVLATGTSWSEIDKDMLDWGFNEGNSEKFKKALVCIIKPFEQVLDMLLLSGSIDVFGLTVYGSNGYNNSIIPLYEALGCQSDLIMTEQQLAITSREGNLSEKLLAPVFSLIDEIIEKPVYKICNILPNIVFFLSSGGLTKCIENLITPIENSLSKFGITFDSLGVNLDEIKNTDILSAVSEEVTKMVGDEIKMETPDLTVLGTLGQLTQYQSKSTYGDTPSVLYKVQAEPTAVILTILRYFVDILRMEENSHLLNNMIPAGDSQEGADAMFAQFSGNIGEQFASMTTDETIEWLYKLFFRERVVSNVVTEEEYIPTVIYKATPKIDVEAASPVLIVLVIAAIIIIINRDKIKDFVIERKKAKDITSKEV